MTPAQPTPARQPDQGAALAAPVSALRGAGPRIAERLARLGIHSVHDLLLHLPLRYQDRARVTPMGALRIGDEVLVQGQVELTEVRRGRRPSLLSRLSDGTGAVTLRFFHFSGRQEAALARGSWLRCFGEVRAGPATLEIVHPEYQQVSVDTPAVGEACLTPVYPSTEGVHQGTWRRLTEQALARLAQCVDGCGLAEVLTGEQLTELHMPPLPEALRYVHRPPADAPREALEDRTHPAWRRLAFDELLAHHLSLRRLRAATQQRQAPRLIPTGRLWRQLLAALPFQLTAAQQRVVDEVSADLVGSTPMHRLVQGDVGAGKTLVAAAAVLQAVEAGYQTAVMAPTELLAEQHYRNFAQWLEALGIEVAWLSGKLASKHRRQTLQGLADGRVEVAVGTHALFQSEVTFAHLGLVVVDEQHRFGVHQRLALREKGERGTLYPHQLIMTATPIPRTLAMVAYADLDSSVIDELPPGRQPVETVVLAESRRPEVVERVHRACAEGRQAYWVCTLVEESEALAAQAAQETAEQLREALPELRVGLVHGRLKAQDKEQVMLAFKAGQYDLLVATTVIEVGVDVPNASLMVIDNAERLGLSQLHQLRGRVGRGSDKSACVLMYQPPLSAQGRGRLQALRETGDGFEIARRDLKLRGPGEVLGVRQSGALRLRVADLVADQSLIPQVDRCAGQLLQVDPQRADQVVRRWLGEAVQYGDV